MRQHNGSASAALASFSAQTDIFEGPSGLHVCNETMSRFVSYSSEHETLSRCSFWRKVVGMPMNSPRLENL